MPPHSLIGDHLRRELTCEHGALHRAEELLARPVARDHKVGDWRRLRGAVLVPARDGGVHGPGRLDHRVLEELAWPTLSGDLGPISSGKSPSSSFMVASTISSLDLAIQFTLPPAIGEHGAKTSSSMDFSSS